MVYLRVSPEEAIRRINKRGRGFEVQNSIKYWYDLNQNYEDYFKRANHKMQLLRPFEIIRNYLERDQIPVKLCAAGRDKDYDWLGWSHWATDAKAHLSGFKNIKKYWPKDGKVFEGQFQEFIYNNKPCFLSLSR